MVERFHHIIAISVGKRILRFPGVDVALSIGVACHVQPMPPSAAALGRCQQSVDQYRQCLPGIGIVFKLKRPCLAMSEAAVTRSSNAESAPWFRRRGRRHAVACNSRNTNASIGSWPGAARNRNRRVNDRLERPVRLLRLAKRDHNQAAANDGNALGRRQIKLATTILKDAKKPMPPPP